VHRFGYNYVGGFPCDRARRFGRLPMASVGWSFVRGDAAEPSYRIGSDCSGQFSLAKETCVLGSAFSLIAFMCSKDPL
jgi:hypothetical protein